MNWFKQAVIKLLKINPALDRKIIIQEPLTFQGNVLMNQILYRGNSAEIEQFFKQSAYYDSEKTRFWASAPQGKVRKMHSGIVGAVIDRYKDIVVADMDSIDFNEDGENMPLYELWEQIKKDTRFEKVIASAVQGVLSTGDGAFKISIDETVSKYPIIEFYSAENVEYNIKRGRVFEVLFYTTYSKGNKDFRLEETYGKGYVNYKLFSEDGKEVELSTLEETKELLNVVYPDDFMMAIPFSVFSSNKWNGRGKALFDSKIESIDALDEIISQWVDAVRMGRVKRYIPEDLIPRDPNTGILLDPNYFDNDFIKIGSSMAENEASKIDVSQPNIFYDAYLNSYISFMDLVLQGIISPSTLGIDLKKTDNAESQREKEKITLHVRNKIVDSLNEVIPELVSIAMKTYDVMQNKRAKEYEVSVKFGEYASPDFDSTLDTIGKAKAQGIISIEKVVDELYGDTLTDDEKAEEVARLKEEQGITAVEEPSVNIPKMEDV